MKKLIEMLTELMGLLRMMEARALKQYGGLGALKYIDKVEIEGDVFRGIISRFDKIMDSIPKPAKKKKKKQRE